MLCDKSSGNLTLHFNEHLNFNFKGPLRNINYGIINDDDIPYFIVIALFATTANLESDFGVTKLQKAASKKVRNNRMKTTSVKDQM